MMMLKPCTKPVLLLCTLLVLSSAHSLSRSAQVPPFVVHTVEQIADTYNAIATPLHHSGRQLLQQPSGCSKEDEEQLKNVHNTARALHNAPDLGWSDSELVSESRKLTQQIVDGGCTAESLAVASDNVEYANNVFLLRSSGTLQNTSCSTAARLWYAEQRDYSFQATAQEVFSSIQKYGHWSLMIWRSTKEVGCHMQQCADNAYTVVCTYWPGGNVLLPLEWARNILPPKNDTRVPQPSTPSSAPPPPPSKVRPTPASTNTNTSQCPDPESTLAEHNMRRALHGVGPLVWNASLVESSQRWAEVLKNEGCMALRHSNYSGVGENLYSSFITSAVGSLPNVSCVNAVAPWYDEISLYDYNNVRAMWDPSFFPKIGHFTAMIWRDSSAIGCTNAVCGSNRGYVVVCQMWPQGNILGDVDLWNNNVPRPLQQTTTQAG